jgi:hypothetical protein
MLDTLNPKLDKYFFVGSSRETKGYYFYNKVEGKVFVARNGVFLQKEFISNGVYQCFFAPARYMVVKITRSCSDMVLLTIKHTIVYHGSCLSLKVIALCPEV